MEGQQGASMKDCDKCKARGYTSLVYEGGDCFEFCILCTHIVEKLERTGNIIHLFMQPDSSKREDFPMNVIDRNMLQARERRANGETIWKDAVLGTT
jgi:hypothetical protein